MNLWTMYTSAEQFFSFSLFAILSHDASHLFRLNQYENNSTACNIYKSMMRFFNKNIAKISPPKFECVFCALTSISMWSEYLHRIDSIPKQMCLNSNTPLNHFSFSQECDYGINFLRLSVKCMSIFCFGFFFRPNSILLSFSSFDIFT